MNEFVLDSSAVLALIFLEPGKERVEEILDDSIISRINYIEVLTKLLERGSSVDEALESIGDLELTIVELDKLQSIKIAELRSVTKHLGLSLGDRACLALAINGDATAVTADKNWELTGVCRVELIR